MIKRNKEKKILKIKNKNKKIYHYVFMLNLGGEVRNIVILKCKIPLRLYVEFGAGGEVKK